jgi:hypothetical protein
LRWISGRFDIRTPKTFNFYLQQKTNNTNLPPFLFVAADSIDLILKVFVPITPPCYMYLWLIWCTYFLFFYSQPILIINKKLYASASKKISNIHTVFIKRCTYFILIQISDTIFIQSRIVPTYCETIHNSHFKYRWIKQSVGANILDFICESNEWCYQEKLKEKKSILLKVAKLVSDDEIKWF